MKTPKRKRAPSVAKAAKPAVETRALDETSVMAAPAVESDLEATSTMPAVAISSMTVPDEETVLAASEVAEPVAEPTIAAAAEPIVTSPAVVTADSQPVVALSSNSTVKDAASLKAALIKVVASTATVSVDARSVERIDTATIQLLCAFVRERAQRQLEVKWLDCPKALVESSRLLGVHQILGLPEAGAA
jgi:ABC-type transporter Mla MlaB component